MDLLDDDYHESMNSRIKNWFHKYLDLVSFNDSYQPLVVDLQERHGADGKKQRRATLCFSHEISSFQGHAGVVQISQDVL